MGVNKSMASKVLSIFLGSESAKLAEISYSGKKVQVYSAYDIELSEGLCYDGVIQDVEGLTEELRQYINNFRIKSKKIVFSIATKRIASKEVVIPYVKEKQIDSLLQANAQDYFPIANINEYTLSYSIIEVVENEGNKQYRLSVIATPNDLLENYYALAKGLKMSVESVDYAGNAILQVIKLQASGEVSAILQLGRENTVINIMNGKTLIMQRSISYGLDAIISAVMDSVRMDADEAQDFLEDNEIIKIAQAYPDVAEVISLITNGVGRIFDFYTQRNAQNPITQVFYLGDGTLVNGIGEAFEAAFGFPTEEIMTLKGVTIKNKALNNNDPTNFLANVGSVIAPMKLKYVSAEEAEKKEKEEGKLPIWLIVLSVVASAVLAGTTILTYMNSKTEKEELERKLLSLEDMKVIERQLNEAQANNQVVQDFLASTKGPNDSLLQLIQDMEKVMPVGTSISSFSLADGNVTISVGGIGKAGVAKFIEEMKALKYVQNVHIDYVSETLEGIDTYDVYNMTFSLLNVNDMEETDESEDIDLGLSDEAVSEDTPTDDITGGEE